MPEEAKVNDKPRGACPACASDKTTTGFGLPVEGIDRARCDACGWAGTVKQLAAPKGAK